MTMLTFANHHLKIPRKLSISLLAGLVFGANALADAIDTPAPTPAPREPAFVATLEREVPRILKEIPIQGVAVGLIQDGKLVYAKGFGFADHAGKVPVTPDTVFVAASLAKSVAARVAMELAQRGAIALDKPVAEVLAPWPLAPGKIDNRLITFRHLLSHTAGTTLGGYQGWLDFAELPTLEESLAGKTNGRGATELFAQAGTRFQYSGGGYTLMQLAIERSTRRKYSAWADELAFVPLGMAHSSVAMTPQVLQGAAQGHGDDGKPVPRRYYVEQAPSTLTTTVHDFAKWMIAGMYEPGAAHGRALPATLSRAELTAMYTPAILTLPRAPGDAVYGLGHFIEQLADGSTAVGHDGRNQAGFRSKFLMRPKERDGIVFFSNSRGGGALDRIVCLWAAQAAGDHAAAGCKT